MTNEQCAASKETYAMNISAEEGELLSSLKARHSHLRQFLDIQATPLTPEGHSRFINKFAFFAGVTCLSSTSEGGDVEYKELGRMFSDIKEFFALYMQIPEHKKVESQLVWRFLKLWDKSPNGQEHDFDVTFYRNRMLGLASDMYSLSSQGSSKRAFVEEKNHERSD